MVGLLDTLAGLPLGLVLLVAGLAAFAESGLGVGMLVPGETAVLVLSTTADSPARVVAMLLVVTAGVCAGDHVGYWIGRRFGDRLRGTGLVRRMGVDRWDRAAEALRRRGATAIVLTRPVPVVRTLTPAAAGAAGLAYVRFLPAVLVGSLAWASVYVLGGGIAAAAVRALEPSVPVLLGAVATAAVAVVFWRLLRRGISVGGI